jgi:putative PEP-CTERM system histidine kinase
VKAFSFLPFAAAIFSFALAAASLARRTPTAATWFFFAGMLALGADSLCTGMSLRAAGPEDVVFWLNVALIVKTIAPLPWLGFSLSYSRGDAVESLRRWRLPLVIVGIVPLAFVLAFNDQLFYVATTGELSEAPVRATDFARTMNILLLGALVLVLMNLEQTFRASVGAGRWQIKFVVLAIVVIFGSRLYVRTQAMLYSAPEFAQWGIESGGLLIGCVFLAIAYARTGLTEIDVYPSFAVLRSSITVLLVGGYLLIVGVLAQLVRRFGGAESFQLQAFIVLLGMAGLAVTLLSDRARQRLHLFVGRHFRKAQHDSVRVWALFSQRLASVRDDTDLCQVSAKLVSETFGALSVTVLLFDRENGDVSITASTAPNLTRDSGQRASVSLDDLAGTTSPFDLESATAWWAGTLRELTPTTFPNGGRRCCVMLRTGEQVLGAVVLGDRIGGTPYTAEEVELLDCIATQVASMLVNLRLATEVANAREMDALRTMSAFFVHDLKNAAASLNLMVKNLPVHFDDAEFRADALRGIGNTATRIDEMIARLSTFREQPAAAGAPVNLNQLVDEALDRIGAMAGVRLQREAEPVPPVVGNREQLGSVITNLVLNARDALNGNGSIRVRTEHRERRVLLIVEDDGCGMRPEFIRDELFRPFRSTKKKGLGIGLFQCRAIVLAHGGNVQAQSGVGRGTTFTVSLPASQLS